MLRTACILSDRTPEQGIRISIMSRHTLEDGKTPDIRIVAWISYDEHLVALAPPAKLVGAYYRKELDFTEYESRYREHISSEAVIPIVRALVERAIREDITLLCIEESPDQCHRKILAEFCARLSKGRLEIDIW